MSADRAEQASGAEPASAWAPGRNETQSSRAGASSHVAAEHWESRAGHPSEALARQGPRLGWGLDRRVMKTLLTRRRGRGAPGWVRGWPWGALLTSRPEGRSRAKRTKRGRGLATPRDPMGAAQKAPHFTVPPPPSHRRIQRGPEGTGPVKWWVWTRQLSPGAQRTRTDGRFQHCPGLASGDHRSSASAPEGSGLQSWRSASFGGPARLVPPPAAPGGCRVPGSRPQRSGRGLRVRACPSFPLGVACQDACRWIQGQLRVLDDAISRPLTRSRPQRPLFQARGRPQPAGMSMWTRVWRPPSVPL